MILKEYDLSVRLPQERTTDTGITLVQNDKGVYKLNVRIFDGVNEIDYTDVTSATITFLKRDNNVVQGNMTVEADRLSYTLGTNEIACPGKVLVGIQLWGSTERLSTARFVMQVEKDLITEDAVQSTSEFSVLQQLKQDLEAIDVVDLTNQFNAHKAEKATQSELGHVKLPEAWITPTLVNAWVNFGNGYSTAGYYKDEFGRVHLKGTLTAGTTGTTAFNLPTGYRPSEILRFTALINGVAKEVRVHPNGNVIMTAEAGVEWASLDGISFRL